MGSGAEAVLGGGGGGMEGTRGDPMGGRPGVSGESSMGRDPTKELSSQSWGRRAGDPGRRLLPDDAGEGSSRIPPEEEGGLEGARSLQ